MRAVSLVSALIMPVFLAGCGKTTANPADTQEEEGRGPAVGRADPFSDFESWSCSSTDTDWIDVAVSHAGTCGIKRDGHVVCWPDRYDRDVPDDPIPGARSLSMNGLSVCVVGDGGEITCFGNEYDPVATAILDKADKVYLADDVACGISGGSIHCWGAPDVKGLLHPPRGENFADVCLGRHYGCGLTTDGKISCWGDEQNLFASSSEGQYRQISCARHHLCALGLDSNTQSWGPSHVRPKDVEGVKHVECSSTETCVVHHGGITECWSPIQTWNPAEEHQFEAVQGSMYHFCGVDSGGRIHCWGWSVDSEVCPP